MRLVRMIICKERIMPHSYDNEPPMIRDSSTFPVVRKLSEVPVVSVD